MCLIPSRTNLLFLLCLSVEIGGRGTGSQRRRNCSQEAISGDGYVFHPVLIIGDRSIMT